MLGFQLQCTWKQNLIFYINVFFHISPELAEGIEHLPVFFFTAGRRLIAVGELLDTLVAAQLVAVVFHHGVNGKLYRTAMERLYLLVKFGGGPELEYVRKEHILLFLAVGIEVVNAVTEVVCYLIQFVMAFSQGHEAFEQKRYILAGVTVMELEYVVCQ
jgi:hypothetical protein